MTIEPSLRNLAWRSPKPVTLLTLTLFSIMDICSTVTLSRPNILSETFCL